MSSRFGRLERTGSGCTAKGAGSGEVKAKTGLAFVVSQISKSRCRAPSLLQNQTCATRPVMCCSVASVAEPVALRQSPKWSLELAHGDEAGGCGLHPLGAQLVLEIVPKRESSPWPRGGLRRRRRTGYRSGGWSTLCFLKLTTKSGALPILVLEEWTERCSGAHGSGDFGATRMRRGQHAGP